MDRVLHINDYPIDAGGGAEVVMRQTIALLRQAGVLVETFTCANLADARRTPLRYLSNANARRALAVTLDTFRPDVVHLHNWYHVLSPGILATLAAYKRRQPLRVVMTAHDYHLVCPNAGGSWFRRWTGRREAIDTGTLSVGTLLARRWDQRTLFHSLLKVAQYLWNYRWLQRERVIDLVICPSRFVQSMLTPTGLPTCWLPHVVPSITSRGRKRSENPLHFVFAGRVEPEKGLFEFLQMLPADFDSRLTIIGEGGDRARCEAICVSRNWRERVAFVGRLSHAETLTRIAECHVLVQPSRVLETYGLTLIEALSQGTNVLAANRGAAREIIDESGVGFLFEPDDMGSLAGRLREIRTHHVDGTLNRFDLTAFLEERSEGRHLEALLNYYQMARVLV